MCHTYASRENIISILSSSLSRISVSHMIFSLRRIYSIFFLSLVPFLVSYIEYYTFNLVVLHITMLWLACCGQCASAPYHIIDDGGCAVNLKNRFSALLDMTWSWTCVWTHIVRMYQRIWSKWDYFFSFAFFLLSNIERSKMCALCIVVLLNAEHNFNRTMLYWIQEFRCRCAIKIRFKPKRNDVFPRINLCLSFRWNRKSVAERPIFFSRAYFLLLFFCNFRFCTFFLRILRNDIEFCVLICGSEFENWFRSIRSWNARDCGAKKKSIKSLALSWLFELVLQQ